MSKRKPYKRYSPEFKREALKRASEEGVTDVLVAILKGFREKTVLVQLRKELPYASGWFSLDKDDIELVRFLKRFIVAI